MVGADRHTYSVL